MREVLPEEVVRAYRETGIEPAAYCMGMVKDGEVVGACGLGVWGLYEGLWSAEDATPDVWDSGYEVLCKVGYERLGWFLSSRYIQAWGSGFDFAMSGGSFQRARTSDNPVFQKGYEAGVLVREGIPELVEECEREFEEVAV